ncbi:MAG: serine/threonine-protein phosphatase [Deltaproteobacteria bacterium]|nr:serine/threonine-protein phosphatase [Deltaproteobacteria bacterium]
MARGGDITVEVCGRTDVGLEREHNEDSFLVADLEHDWRAGETDPTRTLTVSGKGVVLAVCDGMGGAAAGEVASGMAVEALFEELGGAARDKVARPAEGKPNDEAAVLARREGLAELLYQAIMAANTRIWDASVAERARSGMGTTASATTLIDEHLVIAQVGDSRAYLFRNGALTQVTRDQSLAGALIESGTLDQAQAKDFIHSNVILQALGVEPDVAPTLSSIALCRGDVVLICSDGLSGPVYDDQMQSILGAESDLAKACDQLIEAAKEEGAPDNVTVVLARFGGDGLPEAAADAGALVVHSFDTTPWEPPRPEGIGVGGDDDDGEPSTMNIRGPTEDEFDEYDRSGRVPARLAGDVGTRGRKGAAAVAAVPDASEAADFRTAVVLGVLGGAAIVAGLLISRW